MEIVINITEDDYIKAQSGVLGWLGDMIMNGTLLPKGHGRLKDVDAIYEDLIFPNEQFGKAFKDILDDAQTIIEADTESEEQE